MAILYRADGSSGAVEAMPARTPKRNGFRRRRRHLLQAAWAKFFIGEVDRVSAARFRGLLSDIFRLMALLSSARRHRLLSIINFAETPFTLTRE